VIARRPVPRPCFVRFDRDAIEQSIGHRFEEQAAARPAALAVKMGETAWSYATLDQAANRVARALVTASGPAAQPVALIIGQSPALVAAIVGVLKAGKFYVPLETTYAATHVAAIVNEAQPSLILADRAGAPLAMAVMPGAAVLRIDEILETNGPAGSLDVQVGPDAYAYVYYTSGTTGRPKGVVDTHRNVLHNVMRYTNSLGIDREDRLTLLPSPGFSGAVSSLFGGLLNGAAVFPYDLRRQEVAGLGAWLVRERLTIYHSVPALFRHAAAGVDAFPDLRLIRLEGDQMSRRDWRLFRERCAEHAVLVNGLGATECGLVRQFFIDRSMAPGEGVVPIGYPVEDMEIRVVDDDGETTAPGQVGEIAVRSRHLAVGYWHRPDLTERAFAAEATDPGLRTYLTGELGRMSADGCLYHLGRRDARLKIRGQWVDLVEVEAALLSAEGVREAAARVHDGGSDDPRLVAYVVPDDGPPPSATALRRSLAGRLPAAAVPVAFVMLDRLPLTSNGKLDRAALPPAPPVRPRLDSPFVAPRTALERAITAIWSEVLGLDEVGVHDPFFDLGGDSLRLCQVQTRLRDQLGLGISIVELFEITTIDALIRSLDPEALPAAPASREHGARDH
jgi:amino acid adenylation domain-containing protein